MSDCNFKCRPTSRPGLYVMVVIAMLASCSANDRAEKAQKELIALQQSVDALKAPAQPVPTKP